MQQELKHSLDLSIWYKINQMWKLIVFVIGPLLAVQSTEQQRSTYTAAVVEYQPSLEWNADRFLEVNARNYLDIITSFETQTADIIVFPEATFNRPQNPLRLPRVGENVVPCESSKYPDVIKRLSCAIRDSGKYVVINLYMERDCQEEAIENNDSRPCTRGNINIYNTAVAFDRSGAVVAIYRKFNLFLEAHSVRQTLTPDISTFETDFGVKFGLLICFDLNFLHPMSDLLASKVQNFAYPTMWFSEFPFYTGVQIQQSWAYANKVNLLAAGTSTRMTTGSGIYSGLKGTVRAIMAVAPTTRVLIAQVPKQPNYLSYIAADQDINKESGQEPSRSSRNIWQEKLDKYYLRALNLDEHLHQSGKICQKGTCCEYNITASIRKEHAGVEYYSYVVSVFDGTRTFGGNNQILVHAGTKSCSIIACTKPNDRASCGQRFQNHSPELEKYVFKSIDLKATMVETNSFIVMPNSLRGNLLPLSTTDFIFDKNQSGVNSTELQIKLLKPTSDLLTFSILARDFTQDRWV